MAGITRRAVSKISPPDPRGLTKAETLIWMRLTYRDFVHRSRFALTGEVLVKVQEDCKKGISWIKVGLVPGALVKATYHISADKVRVVVMCGEDDVIDFLERNKRRIWPEVGKLEVCLETNKKS